MMPRKLTAVAFMLVMTMLIALKHPVLGYCLCLDTYFAGKCNCQEVIQKSSDNASQQDVSSCSSCCQSDQEQNESSSKEPCDDCVQTIVINVGDYLWAGMDYSSASDTAQDLTSSSFTEPLAFGSQCQLAFAGGIRGSPPPGIIPPSIPIYLSQGVLRL